MLLLLSTTADPGKVPVVQLIGPSHQLPVKPPLIHSRFIAADEQDRHPIRIERKRDPQHRRRGPSPQFFYVGVPRTLQRIGVRATQLRAEQLEQIHFRNQFSPRFVIEFAEPAVKFLCRPDRPLSFTIAYKP
jgi:hypothetical protein